MKVGGVCRNSTAGAFSCLKRRGQRPTVSYRHYSPLLQHKRRTKHYQGNRSHICSLFAFILTQSVKLPALNNWTARSISAPNSTSLCGPTLAVTIYRHTEISAPPPDHINHLLFNTVNREPDVRAMPNKWSAPSFKLLQSHTSRYTTISTGLWVWLSCVNQRRVVVRKEADPAPTSCTSNTQRTVQPGCSSLPPAHCIDLPFNYSFFS